MRAVLQLLRPFQRTTVTDTQWEALVRALFNVIDGARRESSELAREFFDSQWSRHRADEAPRVDLPSYFPEYLSKALRPVKGRFQQADAPDSALTDIAHLAMKETESAGRRTVLRGVESTPEVIRFARVLTGLENCAFCTMLASRGPVYHSRESAGDPQLRVFHKGCDCKIVPVFDLQEWPGRDEYRELRRLWNQATRGRSGKDALNAFRRYLTEEQSGEASQTAA